MEAIKETITDISNRDVGPKMWNRQKQKYTNERLPISKLLGIDFMYSKVNDFIDNTKLVKNLLKDETHIAEHENHKPESVKKIPDFVKFFEIDMTQFKREDPNDYKNFNDFFTREVKPEARPVGEPSDPSIVVCAADSRLTVFHSLDEARDLWIKGKKFSFKRLLNDDEEMLSYFKDGVVANFRLAPQDYHRFHSPVAGTVKKIVNVDGTDYAVEPMAIGSDIPVLSENERTIFLIEGENGHGKIAFIPIGAEKVGLITPLVKVGDHLNKGDEVGYFQFGGSDIVVMFQNTIKWDDDLLENSAQDIEVLLHANERIGKYQDINREKIRDHKK